MAGRPNLEERKGRQDTQTNTLTQETDGVCTQVRRLQLTYSTTPSQCNKDHTLPTFNTLTYISTHLPTHPPTHPPTYLPTYLYVSIHPSTSLATHPHMIPIHLPTNHLPPICLFNYHLLIHLPTHLHTHPPTHPVTSIVVVYGALYHNL